MEFTQIDLDQNFLNQCLGIFKEKKDEQKNLLQIQDQIFEQQKNTKYLAQKTRRRNKKKRRKRKLPKNVYSQICKHLKYLVFNMIKQKQQKLSLVKSFYQEMPQNKKTIQYFLRDMQIRDQICVIFEQKLIEKRMNELHRKACSQQIQFNVNKIQQFRLIFEKILKQNLEEAKPERRQNIQCPKSYGVRKIITRSQKLMNENEQISQKVRLIQQDIELQIMTEQKNKQNQRSHKI